MKVAHWSQTGTVVFLDRDCISLVMPDCSSLARRPAARCVPCMHCSTPLLPEYTAPIPATPTTLCIVSVPPSWAILRPAFCHRVLPPPPSPPGWSEQIPVLARVVAVKDACLPGKAGLLQLALQRYQVRLGPWWLGWPVCVSGVCALPLGWCHAWAESGTKDIVGGFAHLASSHNHLPPCHAACRTVPHHEVACCCGTCKPILWSCHTPLRATSTAGEQ
jgi:hypothetical protein